MRIDKLNAKDVLDIIRKMYWIGNEDEAKIILESMYIFDEGTLEDFLSGESKVVCGDGILEIIEEKDIDFIAELAMAGVYLDEDTVTIDGIRVNKSLLDYYVKYYTIKESINDTTDEWVIAMNKAKDAFTAITENAGWNIMNYNDAYYSFVDELKKVAKNNINE